MSTANSPAALNSIASASNATLSIQMCIALRYKQYDQTKLMASAYEIARESVVLGFNFENASIEDHKKNDPMLRTQEDYIKVDSDRVKFLELLEKYKDELPKRTVQVELKEHERSQSLLKNPSYVSAVNKCKDFLEQVYEIEMAHDAKLNCAEE